MSLFVQIPRPSHSLWCKFPGPKALPNVKFAVTGQRVFKIRQMRWGCLWGGGDGGGGGGGRGGWVGDVEVSN